jgi:hypothetical protein
MEKLMLPVVNEAGVAAGAQAGKEIVSAAFNKIFKKAEQIDNEFQNEFRIDGREMTILCPECKQKYDLILIPKKSHLLPKTIKYTHAKPSRVEMTQFSGLVPIPDAIEITEDGYLINVNRLSPGESYIFSLEYNLDSSRFLDRLVDRTWDKDVPTKDDETLRKYEITAQLKFLDVLKRDYGSVVLRDLEMSVDVAVHQDIHTSIPGIFKQQLETMVEFSKKQSRSKYHQLMMRHMQLQKTKYGGNARDILQDLQEIFTEFKFRHFIDVKKDFSYRDCIRGSPYFDALPFETYPKLMKVISRTDLTLDRPAADGIVTYKHKEFISEIEKVFEKNK